MTYSKLRGVRCAIFVCPVDAHEGSARSLARREAADQAGAGRHVAVAARLWRASWLRVAVATRQAMAGQVDCSHT